MPALINIIEDTYNRLTVLKEILPRTNPRKFNCICSCGTVTNVFMNALRSGTTKSCGCYNNEMRIKTHTKHGDSASSLYSTWESIKQRCTNKNNSSYINYGGRGITLYKDWYDYEAFKKWAILNGYADNLTIERNNNNAGYSPDNCCWETMALQSRNKRKRPIFKGKKCSSQFIGVSKVKNSTKWEANIKINKRKLHLGRHITEIAAAKARDAYIINHNLVKFTLNFTIK